MNRWPWWTNSVGMLVGIGALVLMPNVWGLVVVFVILAVLVGRVLVKGD